MFGGADLTEKDIINHAGDDVPYLGEHQWPSQLNGFFCVCVIEELFEHADGKDKNELDITNRLS